LGDVLIQWDAFGGLRAEGLKLFGGLEAVVFDGFQQIHAGFVGLEGFILLQGLIEQTSAFEKIRMLPGFARL